MQTICELFRRHVDLDPERTLVHYSKRDFSYGQIAWQAEALSGWLQRSGMQRGERVVLLLPNSPEYVAGYLGVMQAGGIVTALNSDTTADELAYTLGDCTPAAAIVGGRGDGVLAEAAARLAAAGGRGLPRVVVSVGRSNADSHHVNGAAGYMDSAAWSDVMAEGGSLRPVSLNPDDVAQIIYTSGTTGRPKGVTLTHKNLAANCRSIISYLQLTCEDSVFVTLPFFYSYGNSLLFTHLCCGGRFVLASDFVFWNRALDLMVEQRATGFAGVPSSFAMLLHRSDFATRSFPDLRYMTSAGGRMAPAVVQQLRSILPRVQLYLMYGQTEATARLSALLPEDVERKPGSAGRAIPGVSLTIVNEVGESVGPGEVGEIVARGESVMQGYWNAPEETAAVLRSGGLHTGDLAYRDEDGYLYIVGRRNDLIKSGAYRINPQEIEDALLKHPGVAEAAVVGLPDDILGECPVAFVVPSPVQGDVTEHCLLDHCRQHLPRYKCIRAVRFVARLPKTSSGKIKRAELRASVEIANCEV